MSRTWDLAITEPLPGLHPETLPEPIRPVVLPPMPDSPLSERLERLAAGVPGLDFRAVALTLTVACPADELERIRHRWPSLQLLANMAVGVNNIDLKAAARLGFQVSNTPGVLAEATADIALGLLLMVTRRMHEGACLMEQKGAYPGWSPTYHLGTGVQGKTLGVVGWGAIGKAFARRAQALGMHVIVLDSQNPQADEKTQARIQRLPERIFLPSCDVISLHMPLAANTRGWLDAKRIAQLKKGVFVLNTARGEIVDELALATALHTGHVAGAGLDVFAHEPQLSEALRTAPRAIVLPHLGSATWETRNAMGDCVRQSVVAAARSEPLPFAVALP